MARAGGLRMGSEAPCGFRRSLVVMYEPTVTRTLQDSSETCDIEENLRYREKLAKGV
mgnify:CR=1 FL=1